jgi:hypothetical protein
MSVYSRPFQSLIPSEIFIHLQDRPVEEVDEKFLSLMIRISEEIPLFRDRCYQIIYLLARQGSRPGYNGSMKGRCVILSKIRAIYHKSREEMLMRIITETLRNRKDLKNKEDGFITLCLISEVGKDVDGIVKGIYGEEMTLNEVLEKIYQRKSVDRYYVKEDEKIYDEYFDVSRRMYSNSLKSSINLENISPRRRSSIKQLNIFKG